MHLSKFTLYETKNRFYIIGSNQLQDKFKIAKIDKHVEAEFSLINDSGTYSKSEIHELLLMISNGNKTNGGLKKVMDFCGIFGFVKFLEGFYMILITETSAVALIGGHSIYHVDNVKMIPIGIYKAERKRLNAEQRYFQIFNQVDMTKNFYFSYSYDLTKSLQHNMTTLEKSPNNLYLWNDYLTKGFTSHGSCWFLPIIYGFVDQSKISVFGHNILITLIARRSRHFAGARFLKRGVSEQGFVANDVETEQIVNSEDTTTFSIPLGRTFGENNTVDNPSYSSFLQHRGSIPL